MTYIEIENAFREILEVLVGKVNKFPYFGLNFSYESDSPSSAGESHGYITVYPIKFAKNYCKKYNLKELRSYIILICIHELSHINQSIDYDLYSTNKQYMSMIENENEINTTKWISDNINILKRGIPNFDVNFLLYMSNYNVNSVYKKMVKVDYENFYYSMLQYYIKPEKRFILDSPTLEVVFNFYDMNCRSKKPVLKEFFSTTPKEKGRYNKEQLLNIYKITGMIHHEFQQVSSNFNILSYDKARLNVYVYYKDLKRLPVMSRLDQIDNRRR